jgi:hypothetical protein
MTVTILQINLTYTCAKEDFETACSHAAEAIAIFPGLHWKIWIINDTTKEAGGFYCFEDVESLNAYINSPIIASLKANPIVSSIEIKRFEAIDSLTALTRGPTPIQARTSTYSLRS